MQIYPLKDEDLERKRLEPSRPVTSWASALRSRDKNDRIGRSSQQSGVGMVPENVELPFVMKDKPITFEGKNRAQIKAQEYERACGEAWRNYQKCLKVEVEMWIRDVPADPVI